MELVHSFYLYMDHGLELRLLGLHGRSLITEPFCQPWALDFILCKRGGGDKVNEEDEYQEGGWVWFFQHMC